MVCSSQYNIQIFQQQIIFNRTSRHNMIFSWLSLLSADPVVVGFTNNKSSFLFNLFICEFLGTTRTCGILTVTYFFNHFVLTSLNAFLGNIYFLDIFPSRNTPDNSIDLIILYNLYQNFDSTSLVFLNAAMAFQLFIFKQPSVFYRPSVSWSKTYLKFWQYLLKFYQF